MEVTGICAVLNRPMLSRPFTFTDPKPGLSLLSPGARITHRNRPVGQVTAAWLDGDLVHWQGKLDRPGIEGWGRNDPLEVLPPAPLEVEIARGELVGAPNLCEGAMTTRGGVTTLTGWAIAEIALLRTSARPWDELTLGPRTAAEQTAVKR
ncbi:hypothetical protein [Streptomyces sp. NPDC057250]|uniref:hypothetical protein n=1 Tax=Streptomyces sp. NPDC057250 TaxID=3346068 RepID=UPI00363D8D39